MKLFNRTFILVLLGMLLITSSACEAIAAQFRTPSERFRLEGDRLIEEGRGAEAILSYRAAFDHDHKNWAALKNLSGLYADQGRRRLALRLLSSARSQNPDNAEISPQIEKITQMSFTPPAINPKWSVFLGESEPVGFSAEAGLIYISLEDGSVLAVKTDDGTIAWTAKLPAQATSAPVVNVGRVWVGAQDGVLYSLDTAGGLFGWKFASKAPIYAPPAFGESITFLASGDGTLYALNLTDGSLKWSFPTAAALHARPTFADGHVYFGSNDGHLYALQATDGMPYWATGIQTQGAVESQAVIDQGRVFFGSGDARIYALDAAAGGEYWRYSTPDAVYAAPILADNMVFAASSGGTLTALDKISGKKVWEYRAPSAIPQAPVLNGDRLLFTVAGSPNLFAVDARTGSNVLTANTGDWLAAGPLIYQNTLYLLGKDGTLISYNP